MTPVFRILTDGHRFAIQRRRFFLWFYVPSDQIHEWGDSGWVGPRLFGTEEAARSYLQAEYGNNWDIIARTWRPI